MVETPTATIASTSELRSWAVGGAAIVKCRVVVSSKMVVADRTVTV